LTLKILLFISTLLFTSIAFAAEKGTDEDRSFDRPSSQRIQYLDNYTQTLKNEVIQLGRFLSDLAWVGSVPTTNNKQSYNAGKSKNALSSDLRVLGKTMTKLEDGLLSPPGFQLVLFLSLNTSDDFILREINISINGQQVQSRKYTSKEVKALHKGGAHRLYLANLTNGKHNLTASYIGGTKNSSEFKSKKSFSFEKTSKRKTLELEISSFIGEPQFSIKEWD